VICSVVRPQGMQAAIRLPAEAPATRVSSGFLTCEHIQWLI
jgi:hypothetical protein